MIRKGLRPRIRPALDRPFGDHAFRQVFPFRRAWVAIGVLAALDIAFLVPAIGVFTQAANEWGRLDSLFSLVTALFTSAWLMGWSVAPLLMTLILALMLFGREVVTVRRGQVRVFIGLPLIGVAARYDPSRMRNVRFEAPAPKSGKSWRGPHLAFDYGANQGAFGSNLDAIQASRLKNQVEMASGATFAQGNASPEDLDGPWEPPVLLAEAASEAVPVLEERKPVSLTSLSSLALIAANLVPVAGTVFLGWRLSDVMVLYWAESAVIGFFNVCKIAMIGKWMALVAAPFFAGHFGGFMAVHFLFIYGLFVEGPQSTTGGDLADVVRLFIDLWPALAALFVSHAYSFFANFIGRREYRTRTVRNQMSEPYARIIFMHLVLIFGGFVTLLLGESAPVLLAMIALKVIFDLRAHTHEHDADPTTVQGTGQSVSEARYS